MATIIQQKVDFPTPGVPVTRKFGRSRAMQNQRLFNFDRLESFEYG
jgi:hypothetical protein